jgi:lipopolysaccharide/colanic/teichoic acid biosynthesis glycosyltransferase
MHLMNDDLRPGRGPIQPSALSLHGSVRPSHAWYLPIKFVVEWALTAMLLVPVGMLICMLALAVRLTSRGKAFYRQVRVGLDGNDFTMIKLRSMVENSEAGTGAVWSQPGDKRVTKIGRMLRDTHMDELPQLWNVLRGEMSLIGPRPERPQIVSRLEQTIPNYRDRVVVRPGLTGLAQVQLPPDSDDLSVKRKLAYDRYYVEWMSPWLDVRIAISTVFYFTSAAFKALCHSLVRSYGKHAEQSCEDPDLFSQQDTVRPAQVAG